jgi:hypothetical protein
MSSELNTWGTIFNAVPAGNKRPIPPFLMSQSRTCSTAPSGKSSAVPSGKGSADLGEHKETDDIVLDLSTKVTPKLITDIVAKFGIPTDEGKFESKISLVTKVLNSTAAVTEGLRAVINLIELCKQIKFTSNEPQSTEELYFGILLDKYKDGTIANMEYLSCLSNFSNYPETQKILEKLEWEETITKEKGVVVDAALNILVQQLTFLENKYKALSKDGISIPKEKEVDGAIIGKKREELDIILHTYENLRDSKKLTDEQTQKLVKLVKKEMPELMKNKLTEEKANLEKHLKEINDGKATDNKSVKIEKYEVMYVVFPNVNTKQIKRLVPSIHKIIELITLFRAEPEPEPEPVAAASGSAASGGAMNNKYYLKTLKYKNKIKKLIE